MNPKTAHILGRWVVAASLVAALALVGGLYQWERASRGSAEETTDVTPSPTAENPDVRVGRDAFQRLCTSCHPNGGAGLGPSLLKLDRDTLVRVTRSGKGAMPSYNETRLSDGSLEGIYAYLRSLSAGTPTPQPTPGLATPSPVAQPTPTSSAGGPPRIPHTLVGRDQCLLCHGSGVAGAPVVPASHAGRTNDMCTLCHQPAVAPTPTPAATPTPTARIPPTFTPTAPPEATPTPTPSATATPTPTPTPTVSGPPRIPHTLTGRDQCLLCHGSGVAGVPQVPASHAGRTNDMCTLCHQPAGALTPTPTVTPAGATATPPTGDPGSGRTVFDQNCAVCHPSGGAGVGPTLFGVDQKIFAQVVHQGKGNMPPFAPTRVSDQQLQDILACLSSIAPADGTSKKSSALPPTPPARWASVPQAKVLNDSLPSVLPLPPTNPKPPFNRKCIRCNGPPMWS